MDQNSWSCANATYKTTQSKLLSRPQSRLFLYSPPHFVSKKLDPSTLFDSLKRLLHFLTTNPFYLTEWPTHTKNSKCSPSSKSYHCYGQSLSQFFPGSIWYMFSHYSPLHLTRQWKYEHAFGHVHDTHQNWLQSVPCHAKKCSIFQIILAITILTQINFLQVGLSYFLTNTERFHKWLF